MSTPRALSPLVLAAAAALASCGDGRPAGPRVEVVVTAVDRPGPASFSLRALAGADAGKTWPLRPVPDAGASVYEAPGAPDGPYALEGEGGWGMIWPFGHPPDLRREAVEPTPIQIGRPYTLYVARESHAYRFSGEWGAFAPPAGGEGAPAAVALRADVDDAGVAAVRFPREAWKGRVTALGRLDGGGVTELVIFEAAEGGRPSLRRGRPAPTVPLRVHAVSAADGAPLARSAVRVEVPGLPLPVAQEGTLEGGHLVFSGLPYLERDLRVHVEAAGGAFVVDREEWRRGQELRVVVPGPGAAERRLRVPGAAEVMRGVPGAALGVQALPAGGTTYGRVPFSWEGDTLACRLPPGPQRLLLRAGRHFALVDLPGAGDAPPVEAAAFRPGTQVRVALRGAADGEVRFLRVEGEREVLAQGFLVAVAGEAEVEALLPAGRYRVAWRHGGGEVRAPMPLDLEPGGQVVLPLDARRR